MQEKRRAAEAFVRGFRTGEPTAAKRAEPHIAQDIVVSIGGKVYSGFAAVIDRLNGLWPMHTLYRPAYWSSPEPDADGLRVDVAFPPFGMKLPPFSLRFSFNAQGQIQRVDQEISQEPPPKPTSKLPTAVKSVVANALANDTPVTVGYVDEQGKPHLSTRGGTVVFSDTQLGIWVRASGSGLGVAVQKNPHIAVYYWDNKQRVLLLFEGRGHIATDEATRTRLYELIPEVEQHQDPERKGRALIIDVKAARGGTPAGPLHFVSPD